MEIKIIIVLGIIISIFGVYDLYLSGQIQQHSWEISKQTTELFLNPELRADPGETKSQDIEKAINTIQIINENNIILNTEIPDKINISGCITIICGILITAIGISKIIGVKK